MEEIIKKVADELNIKPIQVENTLNLLEDGNTVPFIARYRKEMTLNLDEEAIGYIQKEYTYQVNLKKRKEDVLRLIETQGKLTNEIVEAVNNATKLNEVEDIYRPYKQKRKTRATEAIRKGLKPLSDYLLTISNNKDIEKEASKYLSEEVTSIEEAIKGAQDIIAEMVSDDTNNRKKIKASIEGYSYVVTKAKKNHSDEKGVYELYYDHKEKIKYIESHRVMAIERAVNEKVITLSFEYDKEYLINFAYNALSRKRHFVGEELVLEACKDGLERLAFPSVENEVWSEVLKVAQDKSIEVFATNLEKLLLQAPVKKQSIMGFDPAFRTGCKLAILDGTGKMIHIDKIFPHAPINKTSEAEKIFVDLCKRYNVEIVAIGNGTASRESEHFVAETIRKYNLDVQYTIVSEAGASVYSASEIARKEFPDLHVEERSAVSIGRRLLDPLSELIKIDPKSIGVGQYQHDLPKKELEESLDFAILKSVNRVGVDVNTASIELLTHVSGMNKSIAENLVNYRNENGNFTNRNELKKVNKLGAKAFEQASGFLRIKDGKEALDMTSIHPESYDLAKAILNKCGEKIGSEALKTKLDSINIKELQNELNTDEYTLKDIIDSLKEPLRDYRDKYDGPLLRSDILEIEDLKVNDKLQGVVRNVVDFGAFVDIGLHDDGLIHKSKFIKGQSVSPYEQVQVGDIIDVFVYDVDTKKGKVALSMFEKE